MPSWTASCTPRTASPSTARPCENQTKNPPNVASLTPTSPSEPLKPSMGAAVRDHRNAVRDRSESLSAINRNPRPQSPESAARAIDDRFCRSRPRNTSLPPTSPLPPFGGGRHRRASGPPSRESAGGGLCLAVPGALLQHCHRVVAQWDDLID